VRKDNPRLLVRSPQRQAGRLARGHPASPVKVTITGSGRLDPEAAFFTTGSGQKMVYCASTALDEARARLGALAAVVDGGQPLDVARVVKDLLSRGVGRLMVEGGGRVHTQFLTAGLADELQLVVAPFFVGDSRARRFVGDGAFPWNPDRRAELAEVRQLGDVVLLRYLLGARA
jgi:5-amino-6-(5-phosphoribosylamino)uracil reductase